MHNKKPMCFENVNNKVNVRGFRRRKVLMKIYLPLSTDPF